MAISAFPGQNKAVCFMTTRSAAQPVNSVSVSALEGDRPCVTCGFNLIGQSITREPHYGLLIARCPECGSVAPLLEYPAVSKWTRRVVGVLAALWLVLLVGVTVGTGAAMFGITMAGSVEASEAFARAIEFEYSQETKGASSAGTPAIAPVYGPSLPPRVMVMGGLGSAAPADWVKQQDLSARFRAWGGWGPLLNEYGVLLIPLAIVSVIAGVFLGITMLHMRGWRLALLGLLPLAVYVAFHLIARAGRGPQWHSPAENAALAFLLPRIVGSGFVIALVLMTIAVLAARPLARGFIRLMLPARLRVPLGPLWEADGLPPPGVRHGRAG